MSISENIEKYIAGRVKERVVSDTVTEIAMPFTDPHGDLVYLYVEETENGCRITDDGYVLSDLFICGVDVKRTAVKSEIRHITEPLGIKKGPDSVLYKEVDEEKLGQAALEMAQAIIAIMYRLL